MPYPDQYRVSRSDGARCNAIFQRLCAVSIALPLVAAGLMPAAISADFSHSKKTFVPASLIDRRVDLTGVQEYDVSGEISESNTISPSRHVSGSSSKISHGSRAISSHKISHSAAVKPKGYIPPPPALPDADIAAATQNFQQQAKRAASSPQTAQLLATLCQRAEEYAKSGKLQQAKHAVAQALQLTPHDKAVIRECAAISVERARQYAATHDYQQTIQFARQALSFDPGDFEANKLLNGALVQTGVNADDAAARIKQAQSLVAEGKNDEAAVEFKAAVKLKPTASTQISLADALNKAGQTDAAKAAYQQALQMDPNSPIAHRQLGLLKLQHNDVVGANSELSRALIIDPNDQEAAQNLISLWQQQVSKMPTGNSHLGLARAYQLAGDLQSAQTQYRAVVAIDPNNPHLPAARQSFKLALARQDAKQASLAAHTLESQGALQDACTKIGEAEALNPGDAEYRIYHAQLAQKLGNFAGARQAYLDALKIDPRNTVAAAGLRQLPAALAPNPASSAGTSSASSAVSNTGSVEPAAPPIGTPIPMTAAQRLAAASAAAMPSLSGAMPPPANIVTTPPIQSMSNFALALRNHMVVNKSNSQQVEDAQHDILAQIGASGARETLAGTGLGSQLTGFGGAVPTTNTGPSSGAVAAAVANDLDQSVSNTLNSAASALSAVSRGSAPGFGSVMNAMPPIAPQASVAQQAGVSAPTGFAPMGFAPPANMAPTAPSAPYAVAPTLPNDPLAGLAPIQSTDSMPPLAPAIATTSAATSVAPPIAPSPDDPPLRLSPMSSDRGAVPSSAVSFTLLGAAPKLKGVELNVSLNNDSDMPIQIPANLRAIIHYSNRKDAEVKPTFTLATVPPHGSIIGVIKVPFDKVDSKADLFLKDLLPEGCANRDVHLTVQMASR